MQCSILIVKGLSSRRQLDKPLLNLTYNFVAEVNFKLGFLYDLMQVLPWTKFFITNIIDTLAQKRWSYVLMEQLVHCAL